MEKDGNRKGTKNNESSGVEREDETRELDKQSEN